MRFPGIAENQGWFSQNIVFCLTFPKIDGFPGTHGTRSKGAPAEGLISYFKIGRQSKYFIGIYEYLHLVLY